MIFYCAVVEGQWLFIVFMYLHLQTPWLPDSLNIIVYKQVLGKMQTHGEGGMQTHGEGRMQTHGEGGMQTHSQVESRDTRMPLKARKLLL